MRTQPGDRPRRNSAWNRASPRRRLLLLALLTVVVVGIVLEIVTPEVHWIHFIAPVGTLIGMGLAFTGSRDPA